jgi:hypothetical protein
VLTDQQYDSDLQSETGISHYTGLLCYAISVSAHFLSAPLTYKTLEYIERICQMIHVSARRMETLPAPSSNTASKNLTWTTKHGTKMRGSRLTANWNTGELPSCKTLRVKNDARCQCAHLPSVTERYTDILHTYTFWNYRILPEAGKADRLSWVSQSLQTNSVAVRSDRVFLSHTFHVVIQVIIRRFIASAVWINVVQHTKHIQTRKYVVKGHLHKY